MGMGGNWDYFSEINELIVYDFPRPATGMGTKSWEWEGIGYTKVILAHLYYTWPVSRLKI